MTGFDIIVLVLVGVGAFGGFMRGFVQEVLSLAAWVLALFAIHSLHSPLTLWLVERQYSVTGAAVFAFALLLLIPYAGMKLIAGRLGQASRSSLLGPVDRVLGFGFGTVKGIIIAVLAFSLLVLGYDTVWGPVGRPEWITSARTYPFISTATEELVQIVQDRRELLASEDRRLEKNGK